MKALRRTYRPQRCRGQNRGPSWHRRNAPAIPRCAFSRIYGCRRCRGRVGWSPGPSRKRTAGPLSVSQHDDSLRRLLDVGRALVGELDVEALLDRVLEEACSITGARYAALGVLNEERTGLKRFLTLGIDPATHRAIGDLPHGRGVLGVLIEDPRPLR